MRVKTLITLVMMIVLIGSIHQTILCAVQGTHTHIDQAGRANSG